MPNWCEGSLKIRGTKENIERFLTEGINPVNCFGDSNNSLKITREDWSITVKTNGSIFHINGTRRHFIEQSEIEFYYPDKPEELTILAVDFKAAWGIDADSLAKISSKHLVDFKIYGFERGMQFNQDIEIVAGEIIKDEEIQFDDYEWECISPNLGG